MHDNNYQENTNQSRSGHPQGNGKLKKKTVKRLILHHWDSNPRFLNKTFLSKIWILREIRSVELTEVKISHFYENTEMIDENSF